MARERRDSKNRILERGEYQKTDGRYMYRYTDVNGKARYVYSWTLTSSDRTPKGKTPGACLRELEKQIQSDLHDGIDSFGGRKITLNDAWDSYISGRSDLKGGTLAQYKSTYNYHIRDTLGTRKIGEIRYSDMVRFYRGLESNSYAIGTIQYVNNILHPVFRIALRDGLVRTDPTDGAISEIKKHHKQTREKRHALTIPQQKAFMEFLKVDPWAYKWETFFTFLLGTGCRIGEASCIRWCDCDFDKGVISVNHSVRYRPGADGKWDYFISTPKTKAGVREIPMLSEVKWALMTEYDRQQKEGFNPLEIDGFTGFIFTKHKGKPHTDSDTNDAIKRIVCRYNKLETEQAKQEGREPVLLPKFSVHILRHTFCTRLCENATNLKVIQEVMGHANIQMTMDVYNEATADLKKQEFAALDGKIVV